MFSPPPSPSPRRTPSSRARWLALAAATLALHLLFVLWADGRILLPQQADGQDAAPLQQVVVALAPPVAEPAPPPPPKAKPRPRRAPPAQPATPTPVPGMPADVAPAELATASESSAIVVPPAPAEIPAADATPQVAVVEVPPPPPAPQYRFSVPPPATLKYDVEKIAVSGENYYGSGSISWLVKDGHYVVNGDAGVLFISALDFKSSGDFDQFGIAPEIYYEKKFRRPATNTHFNRARNQISFSASEVNYPRQGGEQDRASILWQLAGIGRGDSEKIVAGAQIPIFVAGVRDGEVWPIQVIGQEEIELGLGKIRAWHLLRSPKQGSYDQVIDIWLAPALEWYPVKIRFTEANGDYLDMSANSVRAALVR